MRDLLPKWESFEKSEVNKKEALKVFESNEFKKELIEEFAEEGQKLTLYKSGNFIDLCRGGHVDNPSKEIDRKAFKLTHIAGAYWRGDSKKPQLTRIYGVAFKTPEQLQEHLERMQRAEKFNHKKLGEEMELFAQFEQVGKGLIVWLPKGEILRREIEKLAIEIEEKAGYKRVTTPLLAKKQLFEQSGHLPYYADSMYPPMVMDDGEYYLKAMNCPLHHLIFSKGVRSYKELPLRLAEYGIVHRNELSGTLNGLLRVRGMNQNDAHIYCTKDQMGQEIESVLSMIKEYFELFGLKDYYFRLSLGDPEEKDKFIEEPESWAFSEDILRKLLVKLDFKFVEAKGEAAFYGPKIDVQFKNVFGREETMSTVQLDFIAKDRFTLHYDDDKGKQNGEVFVIHRAPLSTHERFIAFLIEHYAGRFPLWLNPVGVKVMTVTDDNKAFAEDVVNKIKAAGVRVELDDRSESIGKKVRTAIKEKANYMITIGDKEVEKKTLAVRDREGKVEFGVDLKSFVKKLAEELSSRKC